MSSIGKARATQTAHEWQTDVLAAATFGNALVEGDDATSASLTPTTRIGNFTQIVGKTVQISGTLEAVDKAGRKSEKAYQLAKASAEIKRDIVPDSPTCGECSYCRRTQERKDGKPYWAGKDWKPNAAV